MNGDRMLVDGSLRHEEMSLWDTSYYDSSLFYNLRLPPRSIDNREIYNDAIKNVTQKYLHKITSHWMMSKKKDLYHIHSQ